MTEVNTVPRVSVIIPTFNRAGYIGDALRSVLSQTYKNLEVIVVDDGSTDDTERIIGTISDSRLHYKRQIKSGRSRARNRALSLARGEYIAFLDSDDLYLPGKIELQVAYLDTHPAVKMIYTSAYCIDAGGELLEEKYEATVSGMIYEKIAFFVPVTITLPTVMVRKEIFCHVGGFDEDMDRFEDTDMWRRVSRYSRIDAVPEYTCKLRTHAGNSLMNQDPVEIASALEYYASKILQEDQEVSLRIREKGLATLYGYYSKALKTVPHFAHVGEQLTRTGLRYDSLAYLCAEYLRPDIWQRLLGKIKIKP
jgi:glycosyltransferase involved in cell wall biosynthesis